MTFLSAEKQESEGMTRNSTYNGSELDYNTHPWGKDDWTDIQEMIQNFKPSLWKGQLRFQMNLSVKAGKKMNQKPLGVSGSASASSSCVSGSSGLGPILAIQCQPCIPEVPMHMGLSLDRSHDTADLTGNKSSPFLL